MGFGKLLLGVVSGAGAVIAAPTVLYVAAAATVARAAAAGATAIGGVIGEGATAAGAAVAEGAAATGEAVGKGATRAGTAVVAGATAIGGAITVEKALTATAIVAGVAGTIIAIPVVVPAAAAVVASSAAAAGTALVAGAGAAGAIAVKGAAAVTVVKVLAASAVVAGTAGATTVVLNKKHTGEVNQAREDGVKAGEHEASKKYKEIIEKMHSKLKAYQANEIAILSLFAVGFAFCKATYGEVAKETAENLEACILGIGAPSISPSLKADINELRKENTNLEDTKVKAAKNGVKNEDIEDLIAAMTDSNEIELQEKSSISTLSENNSNYLQ